MPVRDAYPVIWGRTALCQCCQPATVSCCSVKVEHDADSRNDCQDEVRPPRGSAGVGADCMGYGSEDNHADSAYRSNRSRHHVQPWVGI